MDKAVAVINRNMDNPDFRSCLKSNVKFWVAVPEQIFFCR